MTRALALDVRSFKTLQLLAVSVAFFMLFAVALPQQARAATISPEQAQKVLEILRAAGVAQEVIDRVSAALDIEAYAIKVTAPNGGEKWTIGELNTITWAPYGYNPDINPAKDVTVYLETDVPEFQEVAATSNPPVPTQRFRVIGKIMDTGKASLHTYFNIDDYDKWATPGNRYYVRAVNNETGAWDRSDAPFTLLPRETIPARIQVTSPNGGEKVSTDSTSLPITWVSQGLKMVSVALYRNDQWYTWLTKDLEPSGKDVDLLVWDFKGQIKDGDVGKNIFKIYVTGVRADGQGYVDDKSDKAFSFVAKASPKPTCTLKANKNDVKSGTSVTVSWTSKNATTASKTGEVDVAKGSVKVKPTQTTTYQKTFEGPGGKVTCDVTVRVSGRSNTQPSTEVVYSDTSGSLAQMFSSAGQSLAAAVTAYYAFFGVEF